MTKYNYFAIPIDKIVQPPPYLWYAGWSSVKPTQGANTQVGNANQLPPPFVIGATTGALPGKATLIGTGPRSQYPTPPPFPFPVGTTAAGYFSSVQRWLTSGTDAQVCSYFSIPFADVPAQPTYTTWFATWSLVRPVLQPGWLAPLAIGATTDAVPEGGAFIVALDKDPLPPPPVLPAPDTSLANYAAWLTDRAA